MRSKGLHGTNANTCANSVSPTYMRRSGLFNPKRIADTPSEMHIVYAPNPHETRIFITFAARCPESDQTLMTSAFNKAALMKTHRSINEKVFNPRPRS